MTTTTGWGTWHQQDGRRGPDGTIGYSPRSRTLHSEVEGALDNWPGIDVDRVADAWREAINAALPDSVALCGDQFYGPAYEEDYDFDGYPQTTAGRLDIAAIIDGIHFWDIVEQHDTGEAAPPAASST